MRTAVFSTCLLAAAVAAFAAVASNGAKPNTTSPEGSQQSGLHFCSPEGRDAILQEHDLAAPALKGRTRSLANDGSMSELRASEFTHEEHAALSAWLSALLRLERDEPWSASTMSPHASIGLRLQLVAKLEELGGETARRALVAGMCDPELVVTKAALAAVARVYAGRCIELGRILRKVKPKYHAFRAWLITALAQLTDGSEGCKEVLTKTAICDPYGDVRLAAVDGLRSLVREYLPARSALVGALDDDTLPVRLHAAVSLLAHSVETGGAIYKIQEGLASQSVAARVMTLRALSELRVVPRGLVDAILPLLADDRPVDSIDHEATEVRWLAAAMLVSKKAGIAEALDSSPVSAGTEERFMRTLVLVAAGGHAADEVPAGIFAMKGRGEDARRLAVNLARGLRGAHSTQLRGRLLRYLSGPYGVTAARMLLGLGTEAVADLGGILRNPEESSAQTSILYAMLDDDSCDDALLSSVKALANRALNSSVASVAQKLLETRGAPLRSR
jgi:hypothetical protein